MTGEICIFTALKNLPWLSRSGLNLAINNCYTQYLIRSTKTIFFKTKFKSTLSDLLLNLANKLSHPLIFIKSFQKNTKKLFLFLLSCFWRQLWRMSTACSKICSTITQLLVGTKNVCSICQFLHLKLFGIGTLFTGGPLRFPPLKSLRARWRFGCSIMQGCQVLKI